MCFDAFATITGPRAKLHLLYINNVIFRICRLSQSAQGLAEELCTDIEFYWRFYEHAIATAWLLNSKQTVFAIKTKYSDREGEKERERNISYRRNESSAAPSLSCSVSSESRSPPLRYYLHLNIWKFMQMKSSTNCSSLRVHDCPCPRNYTIGYM